MLACGVVGSAAFAPAVAPRSAAAPRVSVQMETLSDLKTLASGLNPVVGYWDPLKLAEAEFWDNTNEETIGWLRHAEIKHGRVAMAGFVGYLVHAQHIHFPWTPYPGFDAAADALLSPPEQWDAVPYNGKLQILLAIGFLEWWSEIRVDGTPHYMKGGKPGCARSRAVPRLPSLRRDQHSTGARRAACCALTRLRALRCARSYFPDFDAVPSQLPHWIGLNLYDPFKWSKKMTPEKKALRLNMELNNGRLAMIGLMGFLSAQKIEGSVPLLKGIVAPYDGEVMAPLFGAGAPAFWS